jgi:hypothetical protein
MVVHDPDICTCHECSMRNFEAQTRLVAEEEELRAKRPYTIDISKIRGSELPAFLGLIHRHFEKAKPVVASVKTATVNASVDLLDMVVPPDILATIDSVEIHYDKGA